MVRNRNKQTPDQVPIFLFLNKDRHVGETRELMPYTSDESVFAACLDYCRGISRDALDLDARACLVSLDALCHNLAELFR